MDDTATLRCVLKVHVNCDACKRHTMEILSTIIGAYDLSIDAESGTAQIVGQVNPNYCIRAIARCRGHAEVVRANLSHPKMRRGGSYGHEYDYGGSSSLYCDGYGESYGSRRALPEYSSYNGYRGLGYDEPRAINPARVVDYPPYYGDEYYSSRSYCSIM